MKKISVALKERSYPIVVGSGALSMLGRMAKNARIGSDAIVISNPVVRGLYGSRLKRVLASSSINAIFLDVADTEKSKSQKTAFELIAKIAKFDVGRKVFIVALGGGVVGDVAGFVAAIYKRGVAFVQVPTTFLAQIDSAIGGKTAIDLPAGKNLVGAFYQPRFVLSDIAVLGSLSDRQLRNGLAEAIKYGAICDRSLLRFIEKNLFRILSRDAQALEYVVARCSAIKARIVAKDEREVLGVRTILNFGHTLGHGIETACRYGRYQHGEAVALGMRMASYLSVQRGLLSKSDHQQLERLLTAAGLPSVIKGVSARAIMDAAAHDKKNISKKNRFVLLQGLGRATVREGIPCALIERAIRQVSA